MIDLPDLHTARLADVLRLARWLGVPVEGRNELAIIRDVGGRVVVEGRRAA